MRKTDLFIFLIAITKNTNSGRGLHSKQTTTRGQQRHSQHQKHLPTIKMSLQGAYIKIKAF